MVEAGLVGGGHHDGELKKSAWFSVQAVCREDREQGLRDHQEASRQVTTAGSVHRCTRKISGTVHRSLLQKGSDGRENHASNLKNAQQTLLPLETNEA